MSINLVTYANQTVTPTNDAIIYERAIDQNGILHGCNVTVSGNEVNITGGYGMICGREFVIESEIIPVTLAPSGTNDGRLYVRLDLADLDAPIQLLTAQGNPLPPLEQDTDVNYTNGTYEMELATFTVGVSALSDCVETFHTIVGNSDYTTNLFYLAIQTASGYAFSANQSRSGLTRSYPAKSGYKAIVYDAYCDTHSAVLLLNAKVSTEGTIEFWAVNQTSSAQSNVGFTFRLLYIKTSAIGV